MRIVRAKSGAAVAGLLWMFGLGCGQLLDAEPARHRYPPGLEVNLPADGWKVATWQGTSAVIVRNKKARSFVMVMPFTVEAGTTAGQFLAAVPQVLSGVFKEGRVELAGQSGPAGNVALAAAEFTMDDTAARAQLCCQIYQNCGMLYVIAAAADRFAEARPGLLEILGSMTFVPSQPARGQAIQYVRWTDPRESAFSVEVPQGWRVEGGLVRRNPNDPRAVVGLVSPDSSIGMVFGDCTDPVFILPGFSPFFPEGSDYSPGYGLVMKVKSYQTGAQYARDYITRNLPGYLRDKFGTTGENLRFTGGGNRPELTKEVNALFAATNNPVLSRQLSLGDVTFTFTINGRPMAGYCIAGTHLQQMNTGGVQGGDWRVSHLAAYVAPVEAEHLAKEVALHLIGSSWVNPEWCAMQQGMTREIATIVNQTNAAIGRTITSSWQRNQAVMDDLSRRRSNATLGREDVIDEHGKQTNVQGGSNYYWRLANGQIVGTEIFQSPEIGAQALRRLP